ncbi:MAG: hypothetical protein LR001_03005, partial [Clostridiales bacterium]|nr:hypothetical protein [Clostridiales bacterium]
SLSLTLEAKAFCAHTLRSTGETYLFSTGQLLSLYGHYYYRGVAGEVEILQYMDLALVQKLTLQHVFNKEKVRRMDVKFDATAKILKADHFTYTLFETYLNGLKKPLTGKDALRYTWQAIQLPNEFKMLYIKLIWNHSNRTQKLIKEFRDLHGKDHQRPFAVINDRQYNDSNEKYCKFYHIPHRMYQTIMWRHNMPVTAQFFDTNESMFPLYVSGVPRRTQTSKAELQSLVDKISLLNYYNKYVLEDKTCPYFRGTKEQLVTVMKNCPDGDFEAHRTKLKEVIASFQQTLKDITW